MKTTALLLLSVLICLVSFGCSGDAATTSTSTDAPAATPAASQEMAKCAGCGKEVAKATLVSHDGQMMCKECVAAHNH